MYVPMLVSVEVNNASANIYSSAGAGTSVYNSADADNTANANYPINHPALEAIVTNPCQAEPDPECTNCTMHTTEEHTLVPALSLYPIDKVHSLMTQLAQPMK